MVRPRLTWTFQVPLPSDPRPIREIWDFPQLWGLKVFFLPEPAGMLMLGAGVAILLGLSRMRKR
jgi:hypothetical protein